VFVLTSQEKQDHFEGFGLVFLEAGAHGLPVIGSRTGGISDAVKDGETGFLFDPLDVSAIAEGMVRLIRDPGLARQLGQNGRKVAESLTWDRYADQQLQVYGRVLARSRGS
jgi:glycosyltransferase involved in cell wall biosynthesis